MIRKRFGGADISAPFFDIALLGKGRECFYAHFPNDPEGYKKAVEWLNANCAAGCWIGMEHTGGYEAGLAQYLYDHHFTVSLLDGKRVDHQRLSMGQRAKTDKGDARIIATLVKQHQPAQWAPSPDHFRELLEQVRHRQDIVTEITRWKNRLKSPKSSPFVAEEEDAMVQLLQARKQRVEESLFEIVSSNSRLSEDVAFLCSTMGVQFITSVSFLAEAGPIENYKTPESLALAAGLSPLPNLSGISKKGKYFRIPYGNANLRNCLNMAAATARIHDPALRLFAARLKARGKSGAIQHRAVQRKLIHILWALLTHRQNYDPCKAVWRFHQ